MNHSSDADRQTIELGDFETPNRLARQLWLTLRDAGLRPRSLLDPRCGGGNLLLSGAQAFDPVTHFCGIDINRGYVERACNWLIRTAAAPFSNGCWQFPGPGSSLVFWDGERPITAMVLRKCQRNLVNTQGKRILIRTPKLPTMGAHTGGRAPTRGAPTGG